MYFCIPSSNRTNILAETTLKTLAKGNVDKSKIKIFIPESQKDDYKFNFPDLQIIGLDVKGIGKTRTFIRNYFPVGTKIVMIDDDIKDICSIQPNFDETDLPKYFNECFETMENENVKFAGFCPYDNEYYMKRGYTLNPKYTGGHLILEVIRAEPIEVNINHFEDYVANALYYLIDKKLLRFNGTYVKTKYFNPKGGIIDYYGGLTRRKLIADKLSEKLKYIFRGLLKTSYNKTHEVTNLKLNPYYKIIQSESEEILDTYRVNKDNLEVYG